MSELAPLSLWLARMRKSKKSGACQDLSFWKKLPQIPHPPAHVLKLVSKSLSHIRRFLKAASVLHLESSDVAHGSFKSGVSVSYSPPPLPQ